MSDPNVNEPNMTESDYQLPPPPFSEEYTQEEEVEPIPAMSEAQSLTGIFFEPTRTFESFRRKPRFITAAIIMIIAYLAFITVFFTKIDYGKFVRAAIENSPRAAQMQPEQIDQAVEMQSKPIFKAIFLYVVPSIVFLIIFVIGGLLYMAGVMMMGGKISFLQGVGVWVYSSLPPTLITMLLNILLVFIKDPESYDQVSASRTGLVQANLGFLFSAKDSKMLHAIFSQFDVFVFYGLFLAALGLRVVGKISSGLAWAIVLAIFLVRVAFSILGASFG
jgi:hypothetical protein